MIKVSQKEWLKKYFLDAYRDKLGGGWLDAVVLL